MSRPRAAAAPVDPRRTRDTARELVLPADATAPGLGPRRSCGARREEWGVDDDLAQDAAMVITELVANAVDHARSASTLSTPRGPARTCAWPCATPGPARCPGLAPIDPTAARGRGLQMVDALTGAWGVTLHADGKTVWAVAERHVTPVSRHVPDRHTRPAGSTSGSS